MRARDVTAGEDHDHERRTDRERRNHARDGADHGAADRENEEEGADEFCDIFVHKFEVLK